MLGAQSGKQNGSNTAQAQHAPRKASWFFYFFFSTTLKTTVDSNEQHAAHHHNYNGMFSGKSLPCDMCADASWHKPSASTHLQVNRSGHRRFLPKPVRKWRGASAAVLRFSPQCSRCWCSARILHLGELPSPDKHCIATFSSSSSFSSPSAEFDLSSQMLASEKQFQCVIFQNALQESRFEPNPIHNPASLKGY